MERTALSQLAELLRSLGIRWVLIGALAANRYRSSPRLTQDFDLLLSDVGDGLEVLEAALREAGWAVERASPEADLLRIRHAQLGMADLLIAGTDYQQQAIERARWETHGFREAIPILTPEDVIVHKLIAGRNQDLADVEAVLTAGIPLDEDYIVQWARFWDVLELWRSLR